MKTPGFILADDNQTRSRPAARVGRLDEDRPKHGLDPPLAQLGLG